MVVMVVVEWRWRWGDVFKSTMWCWLLLRTTQEGFRILSWFVVKFIFFSQTNLAHVENLDMKEINFNTSKKDLAEAKIHHMLTEVMAKPQLRQRKYR